MSGPIDYSWATRSARGWIPQAEQYGAPLLPVKTPDQFTKPPAPIAPPVKRL